MSRPQPRTPNVSIPVETGEVSAPELPTAPKETGSTGEKPQQAKEPAKEHAKPQQRDTRRRVAHRPRHAKAASAPQRPFNLFEALFDGQQYRNPQAPGTQQAAQGQYQPGAVRSGRVTTRSQRKASTSCSAPTEPYPMLRQHSY